MSESHALPRAVLRRAPFMSDHAVSLSRAPVREGTLGLAALGLLYTLSTHRVGWEVSEKSLCTQLGIGDQALRSIMAELEEDGYLVRLRERLPTGRWGQAVWIFTDHRPGLDRAVWAFLEEMRAEGRTFERLPARTREGVRRKRGRTKDVPSTVTSRDGVGVGFSQDGPGSSAPFLTNSTNSQSPDPSQEWSIPRSEPGWDEPRAAEPHVAHPSHKGTDSKREREVQVRARARETTPVEPAPPAGGPLRGAAPLEGTVDRVRVSAWATRTVSDLVDATLVRGHTVQADEAWRIAVNLETVARRIDAGEIDMTTDEVEAWLAQGLLTTRTNEARYHTWAGLLMWRTNPDHIAQRAASWVAAHRVRESDKAAVIPGAVEPGAWPVDENLAEGPQLGRCLVHDAVILDGRCPGCEEEVVAPPSPWGAATGVVDTLEDIPHVQDEPAGDEGVEQPQPGGIDVENISGGASHWGALLATPVARRPRKRGDVPGAANAWAILEEVTGKELITPDPDDDAPAAPGAGSAG